MNIKKAVDLQNVKTTAQLLKRTSSLVNDIPKWLELPTTSHCTLRIDKTKRTIKIFYNKKGY